MIKVTGVLEPEDGMFDPSDPTGLTEKAYLNLVSALSGLGIDDVEFELVDE